MVLLTPILSQIKYGEWLTIWADVGTCGVGHGYPLIASDSQMLLPGTHSCKVSWSSSTVLQVQNGIFSHHLQLAEVSDYRTTQWGRFPSDHHTSKEHLVSMVSLDLVTEYIPLVSFLDFHVLPVLLWTLTQIFCNFFFFTCRGNFDVSN